MAERRYNDKEIAAIFRSAAEGPSAPAADVPRDEGLTLAELQTIGREVGIPAESVARAAQALELRRGPDRRTIFGLPLGVSRTVNLSRRLSDEEWERLVVQLREVFNARGTMRADGSLRQWTNGNLQVLLEPTDQGHQLRFRTVHGAARSMIGAGVMALGVAVVTALGTAINGHFLNAMPGLLFLSAAGLSMIGLGAFRLPRWARLRERQMEALAARVATESGAHPSSLPPGRAS